MRCSIYRCGRVSQTVRSGTGQWFAEFIATLGLVLVIFCCLRAAREAIPYAVGLYITSAYWFTASTSFANPAVTIARSLSDTFAGIAPAGVLAFIAAQIARSLWRSDCGPALPAGGRPFRLMSMKLVGRSLVAATCVGQLGNLLPHVAVPAVMPKRTSVAALCCFRNDRRETLAAS